MKRLLVIGVIISVVPASSIQAASTLSGNPAEYRPVSTGALDTTIETLRSRALAGQLTPDDVLRAAAQIKAVQENARDVTAPQPVPRQPLVSGQPLVYSRAGTILQIPVDDSSKLLSLNQSKQLVQTLNQFPMRFLKSVQAITIQPPVANSNLGRLQVQTQGGTIALYDPSNLQEGLKEGVAALAYDRLKGSAFASEWAAQGDFSDFVQSFVDWTTNTKGAFQQAEQSGSAKEMDKLLLIASLFSDPDSARSVIYDPNAKQVAWQVQENHYGFGPFSFDVFHNEITNLAYKGVSLGNSKATIPTQWAAQGLGN